MTKDQQEEILLELSFRSPVGYPRFKADGTLIDQDAQALQAILVERGLNPTAIIESTTKHNPQTLVYNKFGKEWFVKKQLEWTGGTYDKLSLRDLNPQVKEVPINTIFPVQGGDDYWNDSSKAQAQRFKLTIDNGAPDDIEELGRKEDYNPVLVDRESRKIIDGHHRHASLKAIGCATVWVIEVDMPMPIRAASNTAVDMLHEQQATSIREAAISKERIDRVHKLVLQSTPYKTHILPTQALLPIRIGSNSKSTTWRVELEGTDQRKVSAKAVVQAFTSDLIKKSLGIIGTIKLSATGKGFVISTADHQFRYLLKPAKGENQTDTDVKEGLSMVMAYYPENLDSFTPANTAKQCKLVAAYVNKVSANSLGLVESTKNKCASFLSKVSTSNANLVKRAAPILNQNLSHASTFSTFFAKNKDYYIERADLFNDIRKVGAKITGYQADKWCPGDIYFIENGSETEIRKTLSKVEKQAKDNVDQALGTLNALFSDRYSNKVTKPIVAVSLKMEQAQAGKLKSGLADYADTPKEYSLSTEEMGYAKERFLAESLKITSKLGQALGRPDVDVIVTSVTPSKSGFCDLTKVKDTETLKFKYAAYKTLDFIANKVADNDIAQFDDALASLVAYGLGVINRSPRFEKNTKINPPFFKVMASRVGEATRPILFQGGTPIAIFNLTGSEDPNITIIDNPTYKGLQITMGLSVGQDKFDVKVAIRSNGYKQVTVELERVKHIN